MEPVYDLHTSKQQARDVKKTYHCCLQVPLGHVDEEVCIESQIGHITLADLETSRGYGHPQVLDLSSSLLLSHVHAPFRQPAFLVLGSPCTVVRGVRYPGPLAS